MNLILPLALICCCLLIDAATAQEAQKPWYENLPAVAMDYKVSVGEWGRGTSQYLCKIL